MSVVRLAKGNEDIHMWVDNRLKFSETWRTLFSSCTVKKADVTHGMRLYEKSHYQSKGWEFVSGFFRKPGTTPSYPGQHDAHVLLLCQVRWTSKIVCAICCQEAYSLLLPALRSQDLTVGHF